MLLCTRYDFYADWLTFYFVAYLSLPILLAMIVLITGCIVTAHGSMLLKSKLHNATTFLIENMVGIETKL